MRFADGVEAFRRFLRSEYNEEVLNMWIACEKYRKQPDHKLIKDSEKIYKDYLELDSPHEVRHFVLYNFILLYNFIAVNNFEAICWCR